MYIDYADYGILCNSKSVCVCVCVRRRHTVRNISIHLSYKYKKSALVPVWFFYSNTLCAAAAECYLSMSYIINIIRIPNPLFHSHSVLPSPSPPPPYPKPVFLSLNKTMIPFHTDTHTIHKHTQLSSTWKCVILIHSMLHIFVCFFYRKHSNILDLHTFFGITIKTYTKKRRNKSIHTENRLVSFQIYTILCIRWNVCFYCKRNYHQIISKLNSKFI